MKTYKYITIISVLFFFSSCEKDEAAAVAEQTSNLQMVVEPFGTIDLPENFQGSPGTISTDMELGFRLSAATTYNGSAVSVMYAGNTYIIPAGSNEIIVGTKTISIDVGTETTIPYTGLQTMLQLEFDAIDFDIAVNDVSRPADLVLLKGEAENLSKSINAILYPGFPTANADNLELVFLNEASESAIWFGMSLFTTSGGWLTDYNQNSNGDYPRFMSIPLDGNGNLAAIPNSADVAPDVIGLDLFTQTFISQMGYLIWAVSPDGSVQELTGTLPATGPSVDFAVVRIDVSDDTDNPGNKKYVLSDF
jgi:hypothetical protein